MLTKRGLSNLIATVLIVLLALAAVAIVWSFIKPALESTGPAIDLGTKCISVEVEPVSCIHNISSGAAAVAVKFIRGNDVKDIIAVVELTDQTTKTNQSSPPEFLATKTYRIPVTPIGGSVNATTAMAAAVVGDDQGNRQICSASPTTVSCSVVI